MIVAVIVVGGVGVCGIAGIVDNMIVSMVCAVGVPCIGVGVVVVCVVARITRFVGDQFGLHRC